MRELIENRINHLKEEIEKIPNEVEGYGIRSKHGKLCLSFKLKSIYSKEMRYLIKLLKEEGMH